MKPEGKAAWETYM